MSRRGVGSSNGRRFWVLAVTLLLILVASFLSIKTEPRGIVIDAVKALAVPAGQPAVQIPGDTSIIELALVIPKTRHDDIRWISQFNIKRRFTSFVYTTDWSPESQYLRPRTRRGREASTYLSFILDYYDALPKYSVFVHAAEDQWHNDVFSKNTNQPDTLRGLRTEAVDAHGYVNLRCQQNPGCPKAMNVFNIPANDVPNPKIHDKFVEMYMQLFDVDESEVPKQIGNVCCAQFAVSRERILERSRAEYERMLQWADETTLLDDFEIGWMFEKVWHIIFGKDAVLCPRFEQCRCDNFGWCGPLVSGEMLVPATGSVTK